MTLHYIHFLTKIALYTYYYSCMFCLVFISIRKFIIIAITKANILISIMAKYVDNPIYLDCRTALNITLLID